MEGSGLDGGQVSVTRYTLFFDIIEHTLKACLYGRFWVGWGTIVSHKVNVVGRHYRAHSDSMSVWKVPGWMGNNC